MSNQHQLRSMTGFAQARAEQNGWAVRVNLRSVNHRFLDLRLRLPEGFESFEARIRQAVRDRLRRGHVDVAVHFDPSSGAAVQVNRQVAAAYLKVAGELRSEFGLAAEPDLAAILRLPGVIAAAGALPEQELERVGAAALQCLEQALDRLDEMRRTEGHALAEEMTGRLAAIRQRVARVSELAAAIRPAYARRLESRLKELLGAAGMDPARLAQEAALMAERGDISEETSRLESHLRQFENLLAADGEVGKKLDFLLQEMQREANTMLSKTPGVEAEGLAITDLALEVKSEIEKLREQAQNVE
jgi:uncharacterized protein (TIGR00255 family)